MGRRFVVCAWLDRSSPAFARRAAGVADRWLRSTLVASGSRCMMILIPPTSRAATVAAAMAGNELINGVPMASSRAELEVDGVATETTSGTVNVRISGGSIIGPNRLRRFTMQMATRQPMK